MARRRRCDADQIFRSGSWQQRLAYTLRIRSLRDAKASGPCFTISTGERQTDTPQLTVAKGRSKESLRWHKRALETSKNSGATVPFAGTVDAGRFGRCQ